MHIEQELWTPDGRIQATPTPDRCSNAHLVLAFAAPHLLRTPEIWQRLRARWPSASLVAGSTAGEIRATQVLDDTLVATAIEFEHSRIRCARVALADSGSSEAVGTELAERLLGEELCHVFVISDGLKVNGSGLVRGLSERLPKGVSLTGGMCGDGPRFKQTYACLDGLCESEGVVGIGFYGDKLRVGLGSVGGWDPFGPERRITKSAGNVLYELDGQPALDLYERFLGEHAAGLPASGLLFPLTVRANRESQGVVRTILAIDRKERSLTYAGDVVTGHYARLMRANFDRLVDGASEAARTSGTAIGARPAELAVLISCVGRKLVLKQRIEEEVESAQSALGPNAVMTGFYSYGEISPFRPDAPCELHNQTMTVTTFSEH